MSTSDIFFSLSWPGLWIRENASLGSSDARCPGAMEVLSFQHSIEQVGSEPGGRPRSVEHVKHGTFEIEKAIDSFSPLLFRFCCGATYLHEAKIWLFSAGGGWADDAYPKPFFTYTLRYVHICYVKPSGGSGIPKEKIGLKYGMMRQHCEKGNIERDWNMVSETPVDLVGDLVSVTGWNAGAGPGKVKTVEAPTPN